MFFRYILSNVRRHCRSRRLRSLASGLFSNMLPQVILDLRVLRPALVDLIGPKRLGDSRSMCGRYSALYTARVEAIHVNCGNRTASLPLDGLV